MNIKTKSLAIYTQLKMTNSEKKKTKNNIFYVMGLLEKYWTKNLSKKHDTKLFYSLFFKSLMQIFIEPTNR